MTTIPQHLRLQPRRAGKQAILYKTKLLSRSLLFSHLPSRPLFTTNPIFFLYKMKVNPLLQQGASSTLANLEIDSLEAKLAGRTIQVDNEIYFLEPSTCTTARTLQPPRR